MSTSLFQICLVSLAVTNIFTEAAPTETPPKKLIATTVLTAITDAVSENKQPAKDTITPRNNIKNNFTTDQTNKSYEIKTSNSKENGVYFFATSDVGMIPDQAVKTAIPQENMAKVSTLNSARVHESSNKNQTENLSAMTHETPANPQGEAVNGTSTPPPGLVYGGLPVVYISPFGLFFKWLQIYYPLYKL